MVNERGFRPKQKGVKCSVDGCNNWCVSNDLCPKHNMAVIRYGSISGKPATKKKCKGCDEDFYSKYSNTKYCCIECYRRQPEQKQRRYNAVKKYRDKNIEKVRRRDSLGKKTRRRFGRNGICVIPACGKKAEAHHPDYDKPYEIVWLCRQHHRDVHSSSNEFVFRDEDKCVHELWKNAYLRNSHIDENKAGYYK